MCSIGSEDSYFQKVHKRNSLFTVLHFHDVSFLLLLYAPYLPVNVCFKINCHRPPPTRRPTHSTVCVPAILIHGMLTSGCKHRMLGFHELRSPACGHALTVDTFLAKSSLFSLVWASNDTSQLNSISLYTGNCAKHHGRKSVVKSGVHDVESPRRRGNDSGA